MSEAADDDRKEVPPGWYALLSGHKFDIADWVLALKEPFDPVAEWVTSETAGLRSSEFEGLTEAGEVIERARLLVDRLNGAMALWSRVRPITSDSVMRVRLDGGRDHYMFAESGAFEVRVRASAVAVVIGPDGKEIEQPPLASEPQKWIGAAEGDDDLAEMLAHFGRADNWYDVYKAIELAEVIVSTHKLQKELGASAPTFRNMRQTANFYRHARAPRPKVLTTLQEARTLLRGVVTIALHERI